MNQSANAPTPSPSLAYSIAGIRICLRAAAPDVHLVATATRQVFACSPEPPVEIDLSVDWMSDQMDAVADLATNGAQLAFDSGHLWRLYRGPAGDWIFHFVSKRFGARPYKIARLSPTFNRGSVQIDRRAAYDGCVDPLEYPLDELLWIHWLASRDAVELHACGVIQTITQDHNGASNEGRREGFVFVGQSGAGKTTTAQLWSKDLRFEILSDDRTIVRRHQQELRLYGTPWHGEGRFARSGNARLKGIFLLTQARSTELQPLSPAIALGRLMAASFPPFHHAGLLAGATETMAMLVNSTPCFELRFAPDASVVDVVLEHFGYPPRSEARGRAAGLTFQDALREMVK